MNTGYKALIPFLFLSIPSIHAQSFTISTVAGSDTLRDGGPATSSLLQRPVDTAVDSAGNLYIADGDANRVRKVTPSGTITTIAGTGRPDFDGDGLDARKASLDFPICVVVDKNTLYICDYHNNRVRKVDLATNVITTIAGNGSPNATGDGDNAVNAGLTPGSLAIDTTGNIYIADTLNNKIRKITPNNKISTIVGLGVAGYSGDNGPAATSTLDFPVDVVVDSAGNLFIADTYNFVIRKVTAATGIITTYAGDGYPVTWGDGYPAAQASFWLPTALAIDAKNNQLLVLSDDCVRAISFASTVVTRVAGTTQLGFKGDGGNAIQAQFAYSSGMGVAADGTIYVADTGNFRVRRISGGVVDTVAGTDVRDGGPATSAYLNLPSNVVIAPNGDLVISDGANARIRRVNSSGVISTLAGTGLADSSANTLDTPGAVAFDATGTLFIPDTNNSRIMRVTSGGNMTKFAGSKAGFSGDGGLGGAASFRYPFAVAFDPAGNMFIADEGNYRVRKIDAVTGNISTFAGTGKSVPGSVNGPATQAGLDPFGLATDAAGNLFIADYGNHRVLKVAASTGIATIAAGTGAAGFSGDGGPASRAQLYHPTAVAVDAAGNLFIADYWNNVIRRVTPGGIIDTIAGTGNFTFDKESGPALGVSITPWSITVGSGGVLYVTDALNNRIRKLTPQVASGMSIWAGNNGKGDPTAKLQVAVKLVDATGIPVSAVPVTFAVTSGSATIATPTVTTAGDGTAATVVTLGATAGPVTVTAAASGIPPVTFNLTVNQVVTVPMPTIASGGIAGAGLSTPVVRTLSTNGIASIFGSNFAAAGTSARVTGADLVNGRVPTTFAGVCVTVGGVKAPIFAVYPTQINFQVPVVPAGTANVQVTTSCGTTTELRSNNESITVGPAAPEFFYFSAASDGRNPIAAVDAVTGALIGSTDRLGGSFAPAKPSSIVALYGTSFGPTSPSVAPGEIPAGLTPVAATVTLKVGGLDVPASDIFYTGMAPSNPGLYQLNFRVPAALADGDQPVILTVGGISTPTGPYITVKQ